MKSRQRIRRLVFIGAILIISIALNTSSAFAASVGKVTYLKGRVDVFKPGKRRAIPLHIGSRVYVADVIRTKRKSRATVKMIDGTKLNIGQTARIEIKEFEFDKATKKRSGIFKNMLGRMRSVVSNFMGWKGSRFEVHTPTAAAAVRGTDFITTVQSDLLGFAQQTEIIVFDGSVAVMAQGEEKMVNPGQSVTVPSAQPPSDVKTLPNFEIEFEKQKMTFPERKANDESAVGKDPSAIKSALNNEDSSKSAESGSSQARMKESEKSKTEEGGSQQVDTRERKLADTFTEPKEPVITIEVAGDVGAGDIFDAFGEADIETDDDIEQPVSIPITEDYPELLTPVEVLFEFRETTGENQ